MDFLGTQRLGGGARRRHVVGRALDETHDFALLALARCGTAQFGLVLAPAPQLGSNSAGAADYCARASSECGLATIEKQTLNVVASSGFPSVGDSSSTGPPAGWRQVIRRWGLFL